MSKVRLPDMKRVHSYRIGGDCGCQWKAISDLFREPEPMKHLNSLIDAGWGMGFNHAAVVKQCDECAKTEPSAKTRDMDAMRKALGK